MLQQYLPLAVLKQDKCIETDVFDHRVATVLTACGIETISCDLFLLARVIVATVLTACGIETAPNIITAAIATTNTLQQYLPLAVLKRST